MLRRWKRDHEVHRDDEPGALALGLDLAAHGGMRYSVPDVEHQIVEMINPQESTPVSPPALTEHAAGGFVFLGVTCPCS